MNNFFKRFEAVIWATSTGVGICCWAYTSFATQKYVDMKHESVKEVLVEMREIQREDHDSIKRVEQNTFYLSRRIK
jgi:hypothetical protein